MNVNEDGDVVVSLPSVGEKVSVAVDKGPLAYGNGAPADAAPA